MMGSQIWFICKSVDIIVTDIQIQFIPHSSGLSEPTVNRSNDQMDQKNLNTNSPSCTICLLTQPDTFYLPVGKDKLNRAQSKNTQHAVNTTEFNLPKKHLRAKKNSRFILVILMSLTHEKHLADTHMYNVFHINTQSIAWSCWQLEASCLHFQTK